MQDNDFIFVEEIIVDISREYNGCRLFMPLGCPMVALVTYGRHAMGEI